MFCKTYGLMAELRPFVMTLAASGKIFLLAGEVA
jgi:hypothetical protein